VTCPDPETLAALAEGRLSRQEMATMAEHIANCKDCIAALEALNETIATRPAVQLRSHRAWWLAAAAAVVIGVIAIGVYRTAFREASSMARLIELTPRSARPVEARLSGGFPWATYRGPMRANDGDADPQRMRLIGTAGEIVAAADRDPSAGAQQAAGVALVIVDKPQQAIDRLRAAVDASPNAAAAWSDLAAAQYSAALRSTRPSLLPEALASVDRALRIDPKLAEARFNRALILERLGLTQQARAAWQRYLELDPGSQWAVEARERLAKLEATKSGSDAQRTRTFAEAETLGRWAEAAKRGDELGAQRELTSARTTGDALRTRSGESLLRDAVRAIDSASASQRATIASAHLVYRRGRIAYSKRQFEVAQTDLDRAAALFASNGSPMALVARYYSACVRFDRNDVAAARRELQMLLDESDEHPELMALGGQIRWELALTMMIDGDWSGALPLLEQSRVAFERLDERNHLGFIESLLADTLLSLDRADDAWTARVRAFTLLSADGRGDRMPVSMKAAAQMELRSGRLTTARALLDAAQGQAAASDAVAADLLIHSAMVNVALGDRAEAERTLGEAAAAAGKIDDAPTRQLAQTHLDLVGAAAALKSDPARATEMLTRAIDGYRAADRVVFLPECFLLRARAGKSDALADLDSGIAALERSRVHRGAIVGTGVLNAGVALFEDAIRISADRGDLELAFRYAERSGTQLDGLPVSSVLELQQRLAGSRTAVLEVVSLPDEVVTICITEHAAAMERRPLRNPSELYTSELYASELYEAAIRPFDTLLAHCDQVIVVADRALREVSFAALHDASTKRYLVERMAVSTAMSASALRPLPARSAGVLLAVALPSGEAAAGLPETRTEVADVQSMYANAVTIAPTFAAFAAAAPDAQVIHIAGHTQRQSGNAGNALLFGRDRVTWRAIADQRLPRTPVVVLAACDTLAANPGTMTLGDGFLAAGATDVIGTLTPIADADARELFQAIHRRLAAGDIPSVAVRAAQIEAIERQSEAWRAIASLTRGIHTRGRRS
jgi:tetratricopeptide (TPR) repeat protein